MSNSSPSGFPRECVRVTHVEDTTLSVVLDFQAVTDEYDGNIHRAIEDRLCANVAVDHAWVQHIDDYTLDVATDGETAMVAVLSGFRATVWHGLESTLNRPDRAAWNAERLLARLPGVTPHRVRIRESYTMERYD